MGMCSYDNRIFCNGKIMSETVDGQMMEALQTGDFYLNMDGSSRCPANPDKCWHYQAEKARLNNIMRARNYKEH